jgi:hypothetical protein
LPPEVGTVVLRTTMLSSDSRRETTWPLSVLLAIAASAVVPPELVGRPKNGSNEVSADSSPGRSSPWRSGPW